MEPHLVQLTGFCTREDLQLTSNIHVGYCRVGARLHEFKGFLQPNVLEIFFPQYHSMLWLG